MQYVNCPGCGGASQPVKFTWWGGILGPKLLRHAKCTACGRQFNGKTGADNTTGIVIYFAVLFGLGLVFMFGMIVLAIGLRAFN